MENTSADRPIFNMLAQMQVQDQQACLYRANQALNEIKAQTRDGTAKQFVDQFFEKILKQYICDKLQKQFGGIAAYDSTIMSQKVEQSKWKFQISDFNNFNPQQWEFGNMIKFMSKNFSDLFACDFESAHKQQHQAFSFHQKSPGDQDLQNHIIGILLRIKRIKDQKSQNSLEISARDLYLQLEIVLEFFQYIRGFQQNLLSENKHLMMNQLEQARVKTLMELSKEEQANQIIRILQGPNQFEFEYVGPSHIDKTLLGVNFIPDQNEQGSMQLIENYEKRVLDLTSQLQTVQNQVQFYTINFGTDKTYQPQFPNPERASTYCSSESQQQQFTPTPSTLFPQKDIFSQFLGS